MTEQINISNIFRKSFNFPILPVKIIFKNRKLISLRIKLIPLQDLSKCRLCPESLCFRECDVQEVDFIRCQHRIPGVELIEVPTGISGRIKCVNIVCAQH